MSNNVSKYFQKVEEQQYIHEKGKFIPEGLEGQHCQLVPCLPGRNSECFYTKKATWKPVPDIRFDVYET